MFSLSKLLLAGGSLASSGGLSAFFIPYTSDNYPPTVYKTKSSNYFDYQDLTSELLSRREIIDSWIPKLENSKKVAQSSKDKEFSKSLELLKTIEGNETDLKGLYDIIKSKLATLKSESDKLKSAVEKKLNLDANLAQFKAALGNLTQLIELLSSWENSLGKIVSEFKDEEKGSTESSSTSSGGGVSTETEGVKARKVLEEAKKKFEEWKQGISSLNSEIRKKQLEWIAQDWQTYYSWLVAQGSVTWIEQYIQLLNRTIQTTNKEASKKVSEINKNNEELKKTYDKYNRWKKLQSDLHKYQEIFKLQQTRDNELLNLQK